MQDPLRGTRPTSSQVGGIREAVPPSRFREAVPPPRIRVYRDGTESSMRDVSSMCRKP